jgi:hypothetical protein
VAPYLRATIVKFHSSLFGHCLQPVGPEVAGGRKARPYEGLVTFPVGTGFIPAHRVGRYVVIRVRKK